MRMGFGKTYWYHTRLLVNWNNLNWSLKIPIKHVFTINQQPLKLKILRWKLNWNPNLSAEVRGWIRQARSQRLPESMANAQTWWTAAMLCGLSFVASVSRPVTPCCYFDFSRVCSLEKEKGSKGEWSVERKPVGICCLCYQFVANHQRACYSRDPNNKIKKQAEKGWVRECFASP